MCDLSCDIIGSREGERVIFPYCPLGMTCVGWFLEGICPTHDSVTGESTCECWIPFLIRAWFISTTLNIHNTTQRSTLIDYVDLCNTTMRCSKSCAMRLRYIPNSQHLIVIIWRPTTPSNVMYGLLWHCNWCLVLIRVFFVTCYVVPIFVWHHLQLSSLERGWSSSPCCHWFILALSNFFELYAMERERETSSVDMNGGGHITLIITKNSYVNPNLVYWAWLCRNNIASCCMWSL